MKKTRPLRILAATIILSAVLSPETASAQITIGGNGSNTTDSTAYSGAQSLTKVGTNTITLSGDSSYTGVTTINAGTLALDKAAGAQLYKTGSHFGINGAVTVNTGGTFQSWNWSYEANNALSMTGDNYNHFVVNGGRVVVDDTFSSYRAFTVGANGGTLETTAGNTYTKLANTSEHNLIRFTANSNLTVGGEGNTVINDALGSFGNTGFGITKNGAGTLTLGGNNTYTGATTISSGTLRVGNGGTSGKLGSGAISNNGTLVFDRSNAISVANAMSGTGSLTKNGSGTLTLAGSAAHIGGTTINAGTLSYGANNTLSDSATVTVNSGGTLNLGSFGDYIGALVMNGNATVAGTSGLGGGQFLLTQGIAGSPTTKTLTATGINNTIATNIGISSQWGGAGNNANLHFNVVGASDTLSVGGVIANLAFDGGGNATTGSITKTGAGTLTLTGNNTFTGGTTVNAGTLAIGSGGTLANNAANSLTINNGGTVTIARTDFLGNHSSTINMPIIVNSGGILQNSGAVFNTLGALTLNGGTLQSNAVHGPSGLSFALKGAVTVNGSTTSTIAGNGFALGAAGVAGTTFIVNDGAAAADLNVTGVLRDGVGNSWPTTQASSLTKNGTGKMVLVGDNTYTGATTINSGTLALDKASGAQLYKTNNYFGLTGAVTVNTGGTFQSWDWSYGANKALSELQTNYTAFVLNGGKVVVDDTFASDRGFTVGANGATLETTAGNTYTKSANSSEYNLIRFTANSTLTVAGDGNTVINDALGSFSSTGFSITKNGTGTLTLGGGNSYTGATTINGGTLATSGNNRIATGNSVTVNAAGTFALGGDQTLASVTGSGTIQLGDYILSTGASSSTFNGTIAGNGGLIKSGAGTFTLSGVGTFTGDTTLTGGTLVLGSANALSSDAVVIMNAGTTLTVNQRTFIGALEQGGGTVNGSGQLVATLTLTNNGSLNAVLADGSDYAAGILKRTSGTTTIGAANTFTGAIKILGGTLQLGGSGSFNAGSSLVMSAGGTMDLNNKAQTFSAISGQGGTVAMGSGSLTVNQATDSDYNGVVTGTGSLTKQGAGTLTLGGNNTYSGGTTVSGGKLAGTTTRLKGAITNNAQVEFAQSTDGTYSGNMGGSGALVKSGGGSVTLSGSNTHSGGTTISAGKLIAGTANLQGHVANNASFEIAQNSTGTYAGDISGSGSLTKSGSGTVTLSGSNTYSGGTTVSGGKLAGSTSSLQGDVTNNAAVEFDQASSGTYLGAMTGTGSVTKSGAGTLVLSGTSTYSGATTVQAGQLTVNGNLASTATVQSGARIGGSGRMGGLILETGATLTPGNSPGTLAVAGNAIWNARANYNWQAYTTNTNAAVQTGAGSGWDFFDVGGTLTLSGLNSSNRFDLNLWSLSSTTPDTNGIIPAWNPTVGSTWLIASATGGINLDGTALVANTNYSSLFNINTAATNGAGGWMGGLTNGGFQVITLGDTNSLYLQALVNNDPAAVPEPGQVAASLLLLAGIAGHVWMKRRKKAKAATVTAAA